MTIHPGCSRLAIGAAQFGMNYGIANKNGQPAMSEVQSILGLALDNGIDTLDTAVGYGESEKVLGEAGIGEWKVITKLPAVPQDAKNVRIFVEETISNSFQYLRTENIYGLLFHVPAQLLGSNGQELYDAVCGLKEKGSVKKIGISIYSPDELEPILEKYKFDLVQAPFNVFDRRLSESGWLARLHSENVEVHVRSVFLQGLLLMEKKDRPARFHKWGKLWDDYDAWVSDNGRGRLQACLGHVLSYPEIDKLVIGVDSSTNLAEIIQNIHPSVETAPAKLTCNDFQLINPSRWSEL